MRKIKRHKRSRLAQPHARGTIAGSLILTVAAGFLSLGVAVDMSSAYRVTSRLRRVLDAAAIVGARQSAIARSPLSSVIVDAAHARYDDPTGRTNIRLDADKSSADTVPVAFLQVPLPRRAGAGDDVGLGRWSLYDTGISLRHADMARRYL